MARWQPVPIVGGAYSDDTRPWSCQDTVNYLPVKAERPGGRSGELLRCVPGMSVFAIVGSGPIRGSRDVEGKLFVVSGRKLYRVYADSSSDEIGTIPGVGRVFMTHNQITGGNEVFIGNGASGYVYNTVTEVLAQVTDEGFPGAKSADFVDGYIAAVEPLGRFWFHSNLAAATDYNTLDRYEAEGSPDKIVGLIVSHGEALVLSERSAEFFTNTGAATGTFQRMDGTSLEVGCASAASIAKVDNSPFWLGNDGIVYRLNGYSAVPISTIPMSQAISRCNLSKAFATVYESRGHKVYYLTFQDGQTWGYDVVTGEWHRRESFGLDRWRLNTLTKWNNVWIGGDFSSANLYQLRWGHMAEGDAPLVRRKVSGTLHDNQNRVTVNAIELVFDTGNVEAEAALLTGSPIISIYSADALADGHECIAYSSSITVSNGTAPYFATISDGALPTGGAISVLGDVITVTWPALTSPGDYAFTIAVTDSATGIGSFDQVVTVSADQPVTGSTLAVQAADSATMTLAVPAGAQAGDFLVMATQLAAGSETVSMPAGWTSIYNAGTYIGSIGYKAWAGETDVTFTRSGAASRYAAALLLVRASAVTGTASGGYNSTSLVKSTDTSMVLAFAFDASRPADTLPPAAFTLDTPTVGTWTLAGQSYWQWGSGETNPQVQVFALECPQPAGTVTPAFNTADTVDLVVIMEFEP